MFYFSSYLLSDIYLHCFSKSSFRNILGIKPYVLPNFVSDFLFFKSKNDIIEIEFCFFCIRCRSDWLRTTFWYRYWAIIRVPVSNRAFRDYFSCKIGCLLTHFNFSVPDLFDVCIERCQTVQLECIVSCENDLMCISECILEATSCIEGKFWRWFDLMMRYTWWWSKYIEFNFRLSLSNQLSWWLRWLSQYSMSVWGKHHFHETLKFHETLEFFYSIMVLGHGIKPRLEHVYWS